MFKAIPNKSTEFGHFINGKFTSHLTKNVTKIVNYKKQRWFSISGIQKLRRKNGAPVSINMNADCRAC